VRVASEAVKMACHPELENGALRSPWKQDERFVILSDSEGSASIWARAVSAQGSFAVASKKLIVSMRLRCVSS